MLFSSTVQILFKIETTTFVLLYHGTLDNSAGFVIAFVMFFKSGLWSRFKIY